MATTITAGNATDGLKITPDNTGILELKTGTGAGTTALTLNASQNATLAGTLQVAGVTTNMYPIVSGTSQASTSGTLIDFTGIPSWAKRVTVMFNGVSWLNTVTPLIQLGDSGGVETTGYLSVGGFVGTVSNAGAATSTAGFLLGGGGWDASVAFSGSTIFSLLDASTNTWVGQGMFYADSSTTDYLAMTSGTKSLSATLDRVRITSSAAVTFDAGTINIMWE